MIRKRYWEWCERYETERIEGLGERTHRTDDEEFYKLERSLEGLPQHRAAGWDRANESHFLQFVKAVPPNSRE